MNAINHLKNYKVAGKDGIRADLIKIEAAKPVCTEWLSESGNRPIYKKGLKLNCENYPAIIILNTACKMLLSSVVFTKSKWIYEKLLSWFH